MMTSGLLRLLCIHFVLLLTKFHQNISSGCRENAKKPLKKCIKIGRFQVKFSPWRRQVGKNLMRRQGKEIYRRFRISNQIFGSIYGSRDIERSLDPTLAVFGQNRNFMDEYLENGHFLDVRFFANVFVTISSTFWPKMNKIVRAVFEKKSKNRHFDHIFVIYGWTRIFFKNRASSLLYHYRCLTSCKKSEKSLEPFSRKSQNTVILTTFSYFMDDPTFFRKIGLCHFSQLIDV